MTAPYLGQLARATAVLGLDREAEKVERELLAAIKHNTYDGWFSTSHYCLSVMNWGNRLILISSTRSQLPCKV